jgi:CRP/FNR family cyclic AMP-dependent transcriptional regulator
MAFARQKPKMANSIEQRIAASALFSGLGRDYIGILAAHAEARRVAQGEMLFRYGERSDRFYLVERGHVSVEVAAIEGPALELQDLGPGATLGWSWLIAPHTWSFQARAKTAVDLLEFDGNAILARCEDNPSFGYQVLKRFAALMSERLSFARRKMMEAWNPPGFA